MSAPKTEGDSASSWAIGIAFLVIFMAGPADSTVKLAVAVGFGVYLAKGGWGGASEGEAHGGAHGH